MEVGVTTVKVATLEVCARTRVRDQTPKPTSDVVQEYADAYRCGLMTAPLEVFREKGTERYIVADGEHRLLALRAAKIDKVDVRLHDGDEVAALDFAIGCNQSHGVRRTKADKYHAFERIMETPALRKKYATDSDLSEKIGVSKATIGNYKVEWRNSDGGDEEAKGAAKESAAKKAPNGTQRTEVKPKKPPPTPEQKKVAAQVRESIKAQKPDKSPRPPAKSSDPVKWTDEDGEHADAILKAVSDLGKAWKSATRAAQIHTRDVIAEALRDMR